MYANARPKRSKAHAALPSPDDIFIGPSVGRKGKIGVALKGRTAYISPQYARELAGKLAGYADEVEQEGASDLEAKQDIRMVAEAEDNIVPLKKKVKSDREKYADAFRKQENRPDLLASWDEIQKMGDDEKNEWFANFLKPSGSQKHADAARKQHERETHAPREPYTSLESETYKLTANLGRQMKAAGLTLKGPAGELLDQFGEFEHGADLIYPDEEAEILDIENAIIDNFDEENGITMKMMANIILDIATKIEGVDRNQLPALLPRLHHLGSIPEGVTSEQYQMVTQDFSHLF